MRQGPLYPAGPYPCRYCGIMVPRDDITCPPGYPFVAICDHCKHPDRCPLCRYNTGHAVGCVGRHLPPEVLKKRVIWRNLRGEVFNRGFNTEWVGTRGRFWE